MSGWSVLAGTVVGWGAVWALASWMDRDLNRRGIREHYSEHPPGPGTLAGDMAALRRQADEFWATVLRRKP